MGLQGDVQDLHTHSEVDIAAFQWCFFGLVMGYLPLVFLQERLTGSYPAKRHTTDVCSWAFVIFHIITGAAVIYGGAFCWIATTVLDWSLNSSVSHVIAVAAILHGISNVGMLRKVAGYRLLTVPFYIFVSASNVYHGWLLYKKGTETDLLLVWNMVGTYIYVRYFVFLLGPLIGWESWLEEEKYNVVYTISLPLAAIYGILLPTVALGHTLTSAALFACPIILGPVLLACHRGLEKVKAAKDAGSSGLASKLPDAALNGLLQTTDPVNYHGKEEQVESVQPYRSSGQAAS